MGQLRSNQVIDSTNWKEVFEFQSYILTTVFDQLPCNKCGNLFKKGDRITRLLTSQGVEYYHSGTCLKGVEIIAGNNSA